VDDDGRKADCSLTTEDGMNKAGMPRLVHGTPTTTTTTTTTTNSRTKMTNNDKAGILKDARSASLLVCVGGVRVAAVHSHFQIGRAGAVPMGRRIYFNSPFSTNILSLTGQQNGRGFSPYRALVSFIGRFVGRCPTLMMSGFQPVGGHAL